MICDNLKNTQFVAAERFVAFFIIKKIICCNFYNFKCSFSNGGHSFAAVHGNVIQIYSTTTFENTMNLKGHNGKVNV
jgi:hypothetical protein